MNDVVVKAHNYWHALYAKVLLALPDIVIGILIFLVVWILAMMAKSVIVRMSNHSKTRRYLYQLIGQATKFLIIFIGLVMALGTMGINVAALVTSLGLVGFALGFALKDSLSNFLAGFIILFYEPFKVGDAIKVTTVEGKVTDVSLRYTIVKTEEKNIYVPNSTILNNPVEVKVT